MACYLFENVLFDSNSCELRGKTDVSLLQPQHSIVLEYLIKNAGRWVSTSKLLDECWRTPVADNVKAVIHKLRESLKKVGCRKNIIESRRRVGYRFNALVVPQEDLVISAGPPTSINGLAMNSQAQRTNSYVPINDSNPQLEEVIQPVTLEDERLIKASQEKGRSGTSSSDHTATVDPASTDGSAGIDASIDRVLHECVRRIGPEVKFVALFILLLSSFTVRDMIPIHVEKFYGLLKVVVDKILPNEEKFSTPVIEVGCNVTIERPLPKEKVPAPVPVRITGDSPLEGDLWVVAHNENAKLYNFREVILNKSRWEGEISLEGGEVGDKHTLSLILVNSKDDNLILINMLKPSPSFPIKQFRTCSQVVIELEL